MLARSTGRAWPTCTTIENPLVGVLARMEHVGVGVDLAELRRLNVRLIAEVQRLGGELREVAGRDDLNLNSPLQLRQILYDRAGRSRPDPGEEDEDRCVHRRGDAGEAAGPVARVHRPAAPVPRAGEAAGHLRRGADAEVGPDGRIHATFNQTVARTGRLSSDQPNLHNIPVRSDEGRQFRKAFIAAPGCTLLVADYNQIELRCIAHLAKDPGLIAAFTGEQDIHTATASRVFSVDPADVTLDQRSKAKMVSYGLAYGMEAYGLGQRLNIPTEDAAVILDAYFEAFPNVKAYMDATVIEARKAGYTETLFGRRRPIPELLNGNWRIRQAGERQAMNAGIQGLAADIFKVALVRIDAALTRVGRQPADPPGARRGARRRARRRARRGRRRRRRPDAQRRRPRRPARRQRRLGSHLGRRQVLSVAHRLGAQLGGNREIGQQR